jgi:hypothetical protein
MAACCLISDKPGVGNTAGLHGRLSQSVKCSQCVAEYSVEYEPSDIGRLENYGEKLLSAAQEKVNGSHGCLYSPAGKCQQEIVRGYPSRVEALDSF